MYHALVQVNYKVLKKLTGGGVVWVESDYNVSMLSPIIRVQSLSCVLSPPSLACSLSFFLS